MNTPLTQAQLLSEFADGQPQGSIVPQDVRNFIVTIVPTGVIVTSGTSITMSTTALFVSKSVGAAFAVTLPSSPIVFTQTYIIKDQGNAGTYNITVTPPYGTIDGATSYVMNTNYQALVLQFDGANWNIV